MLKQIMNGKSLKTVNANMSDADQTKLIAILVGKTEIYELKSQGGTALTAIPDVGFNAKSFSVGSKDLNNQFQSAFVRLPHVKASKSIQDIHTAVVGAFDTSFTSAKKCEYVNEYYDGQNKK